MTGGSGRIPITIFLVSAITIIAEIAFMRELALRFWSHLGWLVVSIALLGFGASGTLLILLRRLKKISYSNILFTSLLCCALCLVTSLWFCDRIDIDLIQMAWQPATLLHLTLLEILIALPFVFAGLCIAVVLTDMPELAGTNYAASFLGSGVGGLLAPLFLYLLTGRQLICIGSVVLMLMTVLFTSSFRLFLAWLLGITLLLVSITTIPNQPAISRDKDIPQIMAMQGSKRIMHKSGPQGMIELIGAPSFHGGPGTALLSTAPIPPQQLIGLDGHLAGILYLADASRGFLFMDRTTSALPFHLMQQHRSLILEAAGNGMIGLANLHNVENIKATSSNRLVADLLALKLPKNFNGKDHVKIQFATSRQALRGTSDPYSLIILPSTGADYAGLTATEPNLSLTTEAIDHCFKNLAANGMISVTTEAHLPPRESLRLVNLFVQVFQELQLNPATRLIVIRNWATLTLVASQTPFTDLQFEATRAFCIGNGFDLVWLKDLKREELNRFHQVGNTDPPYHSGVKQLLSTHRHEFVSSYVYNLAPPSDDRPFFHNFSKSIVTSSNSDPAQSHPTFREIGILLLWATFIQTVILAILFIAVPLVPTIGFGKREGSRGATLMFFTAIGVGFMLLELGMMQRLTIYLAHPVWATATVLSAFLLFAGLGSSLTSLFTSKLRQIHAFVIVGILIVICLQLATISSLLSSTGHLAFSMRVLIIYLYIAPLALLLGMVFPLGIRRLGQNNSNLISWAWCVNGCASVTGAIAAPLLTIQFGFDFLLGTAFICYFLAGVFGLRLAGHPGEIILQKDSSSL